MRINRKKLLVAMLDANLNQKQLAELIGVSRATINNVSCGRSCYGCSRARINVILNSREVTPMCAGRLAKALNVKVEQIIE